jgi:hypothetical protein
MEKEKKSFFHSTSSKGSQKCDEKSALLYDRPALVAVLHGHEAERQGLVMHYTMISYPCMIMRQTKAD